MDKESGKLITNDDLDWLEIHYPGMVYIPSKNILRGCLWFRMVYCPVDDICVVNPECSADFAGSIFIEDAYELDIELNDLQSWAVVRETAGRIKWSANKWGRELSDVHVYSDDSLCLCPKPEEKLRFPSGFTLHDFLNNLLIPYLFYQSYFEKHGAELWKGSSHGDLGILESYRKQNFPNTQLIMVVETYIASLSSETIKLIVNGKEPDRHMLCPCRSRRKFRDCHSIGFDGLIRLRSDYLKFRTVITA